MTYISKEELLHVLSFIKKRPAMYLYPVTLTSLANFLAGYGFSCVVNNTHQDDYDLFGEFRYWLQKQYHMEHTNQYSWWKIILQNVPSDGMDAILTFYNMLNLFLEGKDLPCFDESKKYDNDKAILVRTSYLIEGKCDEIDKETVQNGIWNLIPEEDIWIDENHKAVWQSTSELYLDPKTMNCGKCAKCHGWTTDMEKLNYINGLCNGATVDGELLCDECLPEGHRWAF